MIKNYKLFKESLLDKLEGPSEEEIWNKFELNGLSPNELMLKSSSIGFLDGIESALEQGADIMYDSLRVFSKAKTSNILQYLIDKINLPDNLDDFLNDLFNDIYMVNYSTLYSIKLKYVVSNKYGIIGYLRQRKMGDVFVIYYPIDYILTYIYEFTRKDIGMIENLLHIIISDVSTILNLNNETKNYLLNKNNIKKQNKFFKKFNKFNESLLNKNESLLIDKNVYEYPYRRILIWVDSYEEFKIVVKYIERNFNFTIDKLQYYVNRTNKIMLTFLNVEHMYYYLQNDIHSVDVDDLFGFTNIPLSSKDKILEYIDNHASSSFYNRNDALNIDDLDSIRPLLMSGEKSMFKSIYQKNNDKSYEGLLNKLEGPTKEQIKKDLYNNVEQGLFSIEHFLDLCKENDIERPSKEYLKNLFLTKLQQGDLSILDYSSNLIKHHIIEITDKDEIEEDLQKINPSLYRVLKEVMNNLTKISSSTYTSEFNGKVIDCFYVNDDEIIVEYQLWNILYSLFSGYRSDRITLFLKIMISLYIDDKKNIIITTDDPQDFTSSDYY